MRCEYLDGCCCGQRKRYFIFTCVHICVCVCVSCGVNVARRQKLNLLHYCICLVFVCSYLPLGVVAMSDRIAAHFQNNVFWGGLTYNSHPMCLAAALAAINVLVGLAAVVDRVSGLPLVCASSD